jgi:lactoylglutathione lyase
MQTLFRVELYVDDIENSLGFYEQIVGLELFGRNERSGRFNYDCFSLLVTENHLLKPEHYFNTAAKSDVRGNGFELIIVVEDLSIVRNRCIKAGHPIIEEVETYPWGMRGFKIADPDGYFIRITSK